MTARTQIIIACILVVSGYAFGRFSAPEKIKEVVKTVEVEKTTTDKKTDTDKTTHKKTTITETVAPDGTKTKTTVITDDTNVDRKTTADTADDRTKDIESTKEITNSSSKTTILATYGIPLGGGTPQYGGSVSRSVLGPITIGVMGNSSGVAALGIGLQF